MREPFHVEDSYIALPTKPGLGVELDEEALLRYSYEPLELRRLRTYLEEGP
jgi:L-alanine-DL-glutamate epimerase-like enolase superfamily enzyme